jgi:hypothetical protein
MDYRQIFNSWRKLWQERHLPEAKPAAPEAREQSLEDKYDLQPDPEGKGSPEPVNLADLQNSVASLLASNSVMEAELRAATERYDRLERSLGLAAARNVVPTVTRDSQNLLDTYTNLPDGEAKVAFYRQNRDALVKLINQPQIS